MRTSAALMLAAVATPLFGLGQALLFGQALKLEPVASPAGQGTCIGGRWSVPRRRTAILVSELGGEIE